MKPDRWMITVLIAAILGTALTGASLSKSSSGMQTQSIILSPNVHRGQLFTWNIKVTDRSVVSSPHGPTEHFETLQGVASCSILKSTDASFSVARTFRITSPVGNRIAPPQDMSKPSTIELSSNPAASVLSPILIRAGHAFNLDGTPLADDPTCRFYSASIYGDPPRDIRVGTAWDFRPPSLNGMGQWVHTTAVSVDEKQRRIRLHISTTIPNTSQARCQIDMSLRDGGVIESETDNCAFASSSVIRKEIGTPNRVAVISLSHD